MQFQTPDTAIVDMDSDVKLKDRLLPLNIMTRKELKQYAADSSNRPKIDKMPSGNISQPGKITLTINVVTIFHEIATAGVTSSIDKLIIGGAKAVPKQFPWQIYLIADFAWLCGGTVISSNWCLTAAHCVYGYLYVFLQV
jgi:hypothetical protein